MKYDTHDSPKKSTCLFGRWKMRTNSSPWSNHSYIGMILGWNVIRFRRAISTLTHWSLPFGSLCSFHFGIWNFILSTCQRYSLFRNFHFLKMSTFSKCQLFKNVHFFKMSTFSKRSLLQNVHFAKISIFRNIHSLELFGKTFKLTFFFLTIFMATGFLSARFIPAKTCPNPPLPISSSFW